jgi:hypothetical protein
MVDVHDGTPFSRVLASSIGSIGKSMRNLLSGLALISAQEEIVMQRSSLALLAMAALLATTSAYAQVSPTPAEGRSSTARPAPVSPGTTGAAPAQPRPAQPSGVGHLPNGNPELPPASTQTHEPPGK